MSQATLERQHVLDSKVSLRKVECVKLTEFLDQRRPASICTNSEVGKYFGRPAPLMTCVIF